MTTEQALQKLGDVIHRKHLALATERSYRAWLKRYCDFIKGLPAHLPSERKLEQSLTALAREDVAASTQNQAFNALIFFQGRGSVGGTIGHPRRQRRERPGGAGAALGVDRSGRTNRIGADGLAAGSTAAAAGGAAASTGGQISARGVRVELGVAVSRGAAVR